MCKLCWVLLGQSHNNDNFPIWEGYNEACHFTVSSCANRVELLEKLLVPSAFNTLDVLDQYIYSTASSTSSAYSPTQVVISGNGWCSDGMTCNSAKDQDQYIEVDFNSEVVVEAILVLGTDKSLVTHYSVEYAGSDTEYHSINERTSNKTVSRSMHGYMLSVLVKFSHI